MDQSDKSWKPGLPSGASREEQDYMRAMARCLVASLGSDEALRCAVHQHWAGLLPLVRVAAP